MFASYDTDDDLHVDSRVEHVMTLPVKQIILHESYEDASDGYDIALLRLDELIPEWNEAIRPICIPDDSIYAKDFSQRTLSSGFQK